MKRIILTLYASILVNANLRAEVGFHIKSDIHYSTIRDGVSRFEKDNTFGVGYDWDIIKNAENAREMNYKNENG